MVEKLTFGCTGLPGSSRMNKTGSWRVFRPVVDHEKCKKCGTCWLVCPDNAMKKINGGEKYEPDLDYCKGCGICAHECPVNAIEMVEEEK